MKILKYDTKKYNFEEMIREIFDKPLEDLDSIDPKTNLALGADTHTSLHKEFYKKIDSEGGWRAFEELYVSFIKEVVFPMFEDDTLIYQTYPNIRFSHPGAKAVYKWHCDGDKEHKHPIGELNIYLPLTDSTDTGTIWCESLPGLGDFNPVNIKYGEFMIGYLNQVRHGNKTNETGRTRVSLDFRVVPGFAHDETNIRRTATTNQSFKVGEYYRRLQRLETPKTFDPLENDKV